MSDMAIAAATIAGLRLISPPSDYRCRGCGATHCKLWRPAAEYIPELRCAACASKNQHVVIAGIDDAGTISTGLGLPRTDRIGWFVPAIPKEEGSGLFWSTATTPAKDYDWWKNLPTTHSNA